MPLRVPNLASLAAGAVLLLAVAGSIEPCWRAVARWQASVPGQDAGSTMRRRFAGARAELTAAGVTHVAVVQGEVALDGTQAVVLDLVAASLHRLLTTGIVEPPPGFEEAQLRSLAEGFRSSFSPARNQEPATVRANLEQWWVRLAGGMNETGIQYGLAPIVVRIGSAWTVGDFPPGFDCRAFAARRRLVVVTDHGDGVVTFREAP